MKIKKNMLVAVGCSIMQIGLAMQNAAFAAESEQKGQDVQSSQQQEWTCPMMHDQQTMHKGGHRQWLLTLPQTSIEGRIQDVNVHEACMGEQRALHLKLKSGDQEYNVHLGPSRFVNSHNFRFALGDDVRVTGALVDRGGVKSIVAFSIEKDGNRLELRDQNARPLWMHGQRGQGMGPRAGLSH